MKRARRSSPGDSFQPTEAWKDAFAAQCTEQLYAVARRFAARRAAVVGWCGGAADDYYVRELVANVISDTAAGILRWDPAAQSLEAHVLDAISRRSNHDCSRALRYRHEPFEAFDLEAPGALADEVEAKLGDTVQGGWFGLELDPTERLQRLRKLADADDVHVSRILDAFEAGNVTTSDIMRFAGLSSLEYDAARKRLTRLAGKLSPGELPDRRRLKRRA